MSVKVLVTGGAGFIGGNLVHTLVGIGGEVTVIDDLSSGTVENLHPAASFRTLDITDPALADVFADARPEVVVHLAAQPSVAASIEDPERNRLVNVEGTRAVAAAAVDAGARLVLFASSAAVYGEPSELPLVETSSKAPENPYGESKLEGESVLAEVLRPAGVDFACLRFANVYGPRQRAEGEGGVVAVFAARMAAGLPPIVQGTGQQTRDFVFVGDVISAILAAMDALGPLALPGADGPAYNVSTGIETSVNMLVQHLRGGLRYRGGMESADPRPGDVERSVLDPVKAARVFGWRAEADLERGLGRTASWFMRG
jgi:UDP-glucose 4-epimerase